MDKASGFSKNIMQKRFSKASFNMKKLFHAGPLVYRLSVAVDVEVLHFSTVRVTNVSTLKGN